MRPATKAKAARVGPAASVKRYNRFHNRTLGRSPLQRSAMNWLSDSATYLSDGDGERARLAALRGLRAIMRWRPC